jgi:hypothetical protein
MTDSNVTELRLMGDASKPMDWLARGLEEALRRGTEQSVAVYVSRDDAMRLIRMIDEANGDADKTG